MTAEDCPFCDIVGGEDGRARVIHEDESVVAFFPTEPAVLGHTLLVPRTHIPDIWGLDEPTAARLAASTLRLAAAIRAALHPKGLNIIQSNGVVATQTVFHLHVHLVPRWSNDPMGPIWPESTNFSETQKDLVLNELRQAISG